MPAQRISKSKLKAKMLQIFREIEKNGQELIVTDRDQPVLRITPIKKKKSVTDVFGDYQGKLIFHEDPDTPTSDDWEDV
jgi:antitoxin (DNA-binding transcriptional repressor) of toxin-antitoxin stability system